ncbi:MAG: shikimate kinase [Candidatus Aerophobetes bacterium]|nr:shikimate kinase [Candidatus Aerophobetes bacterium]
MNIVLTGFMGTGKSVIGKKLAQRLGMGYLDTDEIIEKREKCKIFQIFEEKGEGYFRKIETQVVKKIAGWDNYVIATGGGVVLKEENMAALRKNGLIVCLSADLETIWNRTAKNQRRPLLNCKNPKKRIESLLKERQPYYQKVDFAIDTSKLNNVEVVERIIATLKKRKAKASLTRES